HQVDFRALGGVAHRQVDAADRREDVGEDTVSLRIAGDLVEQHGRGADSALEDVDDAADLALAVSAADMPDLARGFHLGEPHAQILPRADAIRNVTVEGVIDGAHGRSGVCLPAIAGDRRMGRAKRNPSAAPSARSVMVSLPLDPSYATPRLRANALKL